MKNIFVVDNDTNTVGFFSARTFVRSELVGNVVRYYYANCTIEHVVGIHQKETILDFIGRNQESPIQEFILNSLNIDLSDFKYKASSEKRNIPELIGDIIEGRINPPKMQESDFDIGDIFDEESPKNQETIKKSPYVGM